MNQEFHKQELIFCNWSPFSYGSETMRQQAIIAKRHIYPGLILYLIGFYLIMPWIFYKINHLDLLTTWLPNSLLLATSLEWHWSRTPGLFIFNYIADNPTTSHAGEISAKYLKVASILGLAFVASTIGFKNIKRGLIFAIVMLIFTHAIGPPLISRFCAFVFYNILARNDPTANDPNNISFLIKVKLMITSIIGMVTSILLIILEGKILHFINAHDLEKLLHIDLWSNLINLN